MTRRDSEGTSEALRKIIPEDLTDPQVEGYGQALALFGDPWAQTPITATPRTGRSSIPRGNFRLDRGFDSEAPLLDDPKCREALKKRDFNAVDFVRKFYASSPLSHFELVTEKFSSHRLSGENSRRRIASNIDAYVEAHEYITATQDQFLRNIGRHDIEEICSKIAKIKESVAEFFKVISEEWRLAQDAAELYGHISGFSYIFEASATVDDLREKGNYDEIGNLVDRSHQFPYPQDLPLYNQAFEEMDRSLKNVQTALEGKLRCMTRETYNADYLVLLKRIHGAEIGDLIVNLLRDLSENMRLDFQSESWKDQCACFEKRIPLYGLFVDFLHGAESASLRQNRSAINEQLYSLVDSCNENNRVVLEKIAASSVPGGFNEELHNAVTGSARMWTIEAPSICFVEWEDKVSAIKQALLDWYRNYLQKVCEDVLRGENAGRGWLDFMMKLLDGSHLFETATYRSLVLNPFLDCYDTIHEEHGISEEGDAIAALNRLNLIIDENLDKVVDQYRRFVDERGGDELMDKLKRVGEELRWMLVEKLIRNVVIDLNSAIYKGFFGKNIDWGSENLEVKPDGWTVLLVNRCLGCKCRWGTIYEGLRECISGHVFGSIFRVLSRITVLSQAGYRRIVLNLKIVKRAFGSDPDTMWNMVYGRLREWPQFKDVRLNDEDNLVYERMEKDMDLQLRALWGETAPWV